MPLLSKTGQCLTELFKNKGGTYII